MDKHIRMKYLLFILAVSCLSAISAQTPFVHYTVANGLQNNQVRQIVELPNKQILIETEGMYNIFNGQCFVPLDCNIDSVMLLPDFSIYGHLWQGDSLLWLKNFYSLLLFDARTHSFRYDYAHRTKTPDIRKFITENRDSLNHLTVEKLNGIYPQFRKLVRGTPFDGEQLRAYCRDRQGGEWFGTRDRGIFYASPTTGRACLLPLNNGDIAKRMANIDSCLMIVGGEKSIYIYDSRKAKVVRTLVEGNIDCTEISKDPKGRIWICTKQGIYCYEQGTLHCYDSSNTKGFIHNSMRFALPLDDDCLLVCNLMHHLGYFYPKQRRMEILNGKIPALQNYRIMIAATRLKDTDKVAVCTQNGLFVLNTKENTIEVPPCLKATSRFSHKYNCILYDKSGRIWIGTPNGLIVMKDDKMKRFTRMDGLSNTCIQSLEEDEKGNIWVGTSNGINEIRTENNDTFLFSIVSLGVSDGVPPVEMTERGICFMPDHTLWFTSPAGLVAVHTDGHESRKPQEEVVLVGLNVAGKEMQTNNMPLHLNYKQNYMEIKFSALNYANPQQTRYRYRLKGADNKWVYMFDCGALGIVHFNALIPGTYTVELQAATNGNQWGPTFSKTFVIHPPLWLTWWAKSLYLIAGLTLLVFCISFYLRRRQVKMERENELRVNKLFELRNEARSQFAKSVKIEAEKIATNQEEEAFVKQMLSAIEKNMEDTDYTVDKLARDIGISRAGLYKKMQAMLGITPNDFMRNVKLKQAARLLTETEIPVSQISLMVGFLTPRYFSSCFKKVFGITPTEYRDGNIRQHLHE